MKEKKKIKGGYLLGKLLDFILTENELNPTSLGYFQKAISILITKQGLFWNYLIKFPKYVNALVNHSYNKSICDIVHKLLLLEGTEKNEVSDD